MITIFGNFFQFSAEKIGVFLKYQCYDQLFFKFSFVLSQKRQVFAQFFGENILKLITSVPGAYPTKRYKYWFTNICILHILHAFLLLLINIPCFVDITNNVNVNVSAGEEIS
jgi:hypothetical protein